MEIMGLADKSASIEDSKQHTSVFPVHTTNQVSSMPGAPPTHCHAASGRMVPLTGADTEAVCKAFHLMAWSCGSTVVLFLLGSFLPIPSLALSACILAGFTGSCLWPTMLAVTADRYPTGGASMFGALAALGNAGGIFMPWAVGLIADFSNLHWGLALSALAPLFMLPLVLRLMVRARCAP